MRQSRHWKAEDAIFFSQSCSFTYHNPPFIKTLKNGSAFTSRASQPTGIDYNMCKLCFCTRRAHFRSHFGIVLMGWSLVCACWQSVRNICFGRCCGHMIPSIHKVPACPFTALYTVSHCTDGHTVITYSAFAVQYMAYKRLCSFSSRLFYMFFFLTISTWFFFHNAFVICSFQPFTVSLFNVWNTPMFFVVVVVFPHSIFLAFVRLIDLMHGGFVLELHCCFVFM